MRPGSRAHGVSSHPVPEFCDDGEEEKHSHEQHNSQMMGWLPEKHICLLYDNINVFVLGTNYYFLIIKIM